MRVEFPVCRLYLISNQTKKAKKDTKPEKHLESVVTVRISAKFNWKRMKKIKFRSKIESLPKNKRYNPYKHWAVAFYLSTRTRF